MHIFNKMWFSLTVFLLASSACLADVTEERMKASRLAPLRSRRMIGGLTSAHVPWQAMIYLGDNVFDGGYASGTLISDRWILTAGKNLFVRKGLSDIQGKDPVIPKVYLGITDLVEANASNEVAVEKVVLHPGFANQSEWDNNIALIQLKKPVVMSDKVTPIPLPERGQNLADTEGVSGVIVGWGWGALLTPASVLKHLAVSVANHSDCKAEYEGRVLSPAVDDKMFCTAKNKNEENVCFGDAGGALAVLDVLTMDIYAAGILSYDKACRNHKYAVFTKTSSYLPWIHGVIRGDTNTSQSLRTSKMINMYMLNLL